VGEWHRGCERLPLQLARTARIHVPGCASLRCGFRYKGGRPVSDGGRIALRCGGCADLRVRHPWRGEVWRGTHSDATGSLSRLSCQPQTGKPASGEAGGLCWCRLFPDAPLSLPSRADHVSKCHSGTSGGREWGLIPGDALRVHKGTYADNYGCFRRRRNPADLSRQAGRRTAA